jgi:hypothetical protein
MFSMSPFRHDPESWPIQYAFQAEIGYRGFVIPDPRLLALGVKFSSLEDLVEQELKPRFG